MNRAIPPQPTPPYTNGHYETPLTISGVSLHRPAPLQTPTVFPPDLPLRGAGPILYALHRFLLAGLPFSRYVATFWLFIALLAGVDALPGRWITMSVALLIWILQVTFGLRFQRRHHSSFTATTVPPLNDVPLEPSEKLPIYATGLLNVEGRYQSYSALPGFYRTFATGEHAILCRVLDRKWLGLLNWPADELGMWYAFIHPTEIQQLQWGHLQFGVTVYPALAITYRLEIPPSPRRKRAQIRQETLYLATPKTDDAQRLYVDLLYNLPAETVETSLSSSK